MGLYQNIIEKASEKGLKLSQLSIKSGVKRDTIAKWQNHMAAADSLAKVAKALGTTSEQLLEEKE